MSLTFNDYINIVKSSVAKRKVKIEILDSSENVVSTITPNLLSGDIQKSSDNGSRRSANITLSNEDLSFIPNADGDFWVQSKFRLWTGYENNNGETYYISQGIYVMGEPEISSHMAETTATYSLYDKWTLLEDELESPYVINAGESISDVVKQLFTDFGEVKPVLIYPTSETLPYSITTDYSKTWADLLIELAQILSWNVYYDNNGYPRFEPATNVSNTASTWSFTTGEVNYLGATRRYTFSELANFVKVIGDNIDGTLIQATASDTNPTSPTRISLIGKRVKIIEDSNIYTNELASQRAQYELEQSISLSELINAECIVVDHIEGSQIVDITDSGLGCNQTRYQVKSCSMPLVNEGNMSLSLWAARSLS